MNERDRCFHSAVLSAVKAKMLFDVLAGHRFVFLCGVDIFSLCFLTGIARIRTTDFMNDAFAIGGLRQIRNSGIPLRLRQAFGIITAVLKENAFVDQFPSAARPHKSEAICLGRSGRLFCRLGRGISLKIGRAVSVLCKRSYYADGTLHSFMINGADSPEHPWQVADTVEFPPALMEGFILHEAFPAFDNLFDIVPVRLVADVEDFLEQPVRMDSVSGFNDDGRLYRQCHKKTHKHFLRLREVLFLMGIALDVEIRICSDDCRDIFSVSAPEFTKSGRSGIDAEIGVAGFSGFDSVCSHLIKMSGIEPPCSGLTVFKYRYGQISVTK